MVHIGADFFRIVPSQLPINPRLGNQGPIRVGTALRRRVTRMVLFRRPQVCARRMFSVNRRTRDWPVDCQRQSMQGFTRLIPGAPCVFGTAALVENYRLIAVQQHSVFIMPADGAGKHNFFQVAAFLNQVIQRVAVGDPDHVLLDDGAVVETSVT